MQLLYSAIGVVSAICFFVGLFYLLFKRGKRLRGLGMVVLSFIVAGFAGVGLQREEALEAGFKSSADMRLAKEAGIAAPAEFEARRAELEAAAKLKAQADAEERIRLAAEKKAQDEAAAIESARQAELEKARKLAADAYYTAPASQVAFVAAIEKGRLEMKDAPNDLAKGGIRRDRAKALCDAQRKPVVDDWSGVLSNLSTNSDGLGVVEVSIGKDATVGTWNNAFSDAGAKTLLDPDSALFRKLAQLKEGQQVRFSGSFLTGGNDCFREMSMSLEGAMDEPEFVFRFKDVWVMP